MTMVRETACGDAAATDDDGFCSRRPLSEALADVVAAVDRLAAADVSVPGTGETLDVVRGVERQLRRLQGISVHLVGQIQQRGLDAPAGATSSAVLLRQILTIGKGDAADRVRLAGAVCGSVGVSGAPVPPVLPVLAAAVAAGSLGQRQAGTIAATMGRLPAAVPVELRVSVEEFLVEQGAVLDPVTMDRVARQIELIADPDGTADERDAHKKMDFTLGRRRPDGLTRCWGLLDDLTAEALRAAFGAMCSPTADRDQPGPVGQPHPDDTDASVAGGAGPAAAPGRRAPATHTALDAYTAPDAHTAPEIDAPGDPDTPAGDGAHGSAAAPVWRPTRPPYEWAPLGTLAGDYPPRPQPPDRRNSTQTNQHPTQAIPTPGRYPTPAYPTPGHPGTGGPPPPPSPSPDDHRHKFLELGVAPTQGGERPHLLVTVTEQDLRERTRSGTLGYGEHLPIGQVRMLACDARIIPAVLGGETETLDMGRGTRTFTAACRRAIGSRDIGCVFPGCDIPGMWAEYHHIHHWADGGASNYNNGALLCRRHHTLIHQGNGRSASAPTTTPKSSRHHPRPHPTPPAQHPAQTTPIQLAGRTRAGRMRESGQ